MLLELKWTFHQIARCARRSFNVLGRAGIELLTMPSLEFGFVVEGIHLAYAAIHEELNDTANFRRSWKQRVGNRVISSKLIRYKTRQRHSPQARLPNSKELDGV